jgi:hypothetical protein
VKAAKSRQIVPNDYKHREGAEEGTGSGLVIAKLTALVASRPHRGRRQINRTDS